MTATEKDRKIRDSEIQIRCYKSLQRHHERKSNVGSAISTANWIERLERELAALKALPLDPPPENPR
jgi:hypothetical protein